MAARETASETDERLLVEAVAIFRARISKHVSQVRPGKEII
jgi:hypothetical protein